ncbi:MAG TPA: glycosyltransferase family 2 protein, partial [Candidatus Dojkabacteria bacterium]
GHNRWGNFRLKLEKMFVDKDKLENYEGEISGKLKVKINDVKVRKEISDINLSLSLYNDKDALIALDKIILKEEFVEDEYIIIPFSIKIADLVQGFYRFSIRLSHYDDRLKIVYDHWDKDNTKFIRTNKREVPGILNTQSFFVNPEIVGIIRMRNEELILRDTLDSFSKIVDRIIIFDDASTDKSVEIARKHPAVIEVIQNKIWKKNRIQEETNHRDILLKAARKYNPNWIFYSDCDERFEGEIRSFLQSDGSKDVDGIKITLFDAYITPEDKKPYKDGSLYNFRKYFGPEKRDILMIWRNLDNVVYEGTDRREPILGDEANIITKFYCQHYGKALSEKHWDDTCEYYSKYFPEPYKSKWEARKGRAVHDKSDFGNKLYKWDEVKEEDIYNS